MNVKASLIRRATCRVLPIRRRRRQSRSPCCRERVARPTRGSGDYAYEALNLVDGRRSAQEIRDALTAIYGPVPLAAVVEYLRALETVSVLKVQP